MIAAIILLLLAVFGITPSDEELAAYERDYQRRVHHVFVEIGSDIDENGLSSTFAVGWEALLDPSGRGSAFEIFGESVGLPFTDEARYLLGVGGGYYVHPMLRLGIAAGPLFGPGRVEFRGRVEVLGRFQIFKVTVDPFIRLATGTDATFDFAVGGRFEY